MEKILNEIREFAKNHPIKTKDQFISEFTELCQNKEIDKITKIINNDNSLRLLNNNNIIYMRADYAFRNKEFDLFEILFDKIENKKEDFKSQSLLFLASSKSMSGIIDNEYEKIFKILNLKEQGEIYGLLIISAVRENLNLVLLL